MFQSKSCVVESPCGCCDVHPSLGLNYVQDLGVLGETYNFLVGCAGSGEARPDRSYEGVLSSVYELTILVVLPTHFLRSLINPTIKMAWLVV